MNIDASQTRSHSQFGGQKQARTTLIHLSSLRFPRELHNKIILEFLVLTSLFIMTQGMSPTFRRDSYLSLRDPRSTKTEVENAAETSAIL